MGGGHCGVRSVCGAGLMCLAQLLVLVVTLSAGDHQTVHVPRSAPVHRLQHSLKLTSNNNYQES